MLKGFICPDGTVIDKDICFHKCRTGQRCLTLPTLMSVGYDRKWEGKPSTTQCINGTRYEFLKLTRDYYMDPKDKAFALLGTRHHFKLEAITKKLNALGEERIDDDETRSTLDLLEPDEQPDTYVLTDYKTAGSYKVAKALGLVVVGKAPDPSGETYRSSGKWGKAGSPRMVNQYNRNDKAVDMDDWELQLNHYRLKVENIGFPITRMQIQATVRDGGTQSATQRGIEDNIYLIPVKRIDDHVVNLYFADKANALCCYMNTNELPPLCSKKESWDGKRCLEYCEVAEYCKEYENQIKEEK